ncbi:hypothetical protein ACP70R_004646 [Stipagrostis hirtigluma subsp. patula]
MAPSHILIAMLVAFAVVSPAAQATRAHGEAAAAPAPGEAVLHLSAMEPLLPLVPCSWIPDIPLIKDILKLICYDDTPKPPPPPKPCRQMLTSMAKPCASFLTTNASDEAPSAACCRGYLDVEAKEFLCLCRITNGDIAQFLPAPINMTRVDVFPDACDGIINLKAFANCEKDGIPMPPMDDPSPPPPAH